VRTVAPSYIPAVYGVPSSCYSHLYVMTPPFRQAKHPPQLLYGYSQEVRVVQLSPCYGQESRAPRLMRRHPPHPQKIVNVHTNLRFCLRLEGWEVVHRHIEQGGKVVLSATPYCNREEKSLRPSFWDPSL
jgi:hypothetical protein